jgi:hypothetical protein
VGNTDSAHRPLWTSCRANRSKPTIRQATLRTTGTAASNRSVQLQSMHTKLNSDVNIDGVQVKIPVVWMSNCVIVETDSAYPVQPQGSSQELVATCSGSCQGSVRHSRHVHADATSAALIHQRLHQSYRDHRRQMNSPAFSAATILCQPSNFVASDQVLQVHEQANATAPLTWKASPKIRRNFFGAPQLYQSTHGYPAVQPSTLATWIPTLDCALAIRHPSCNNAQADVQTGA